MSFRYPFLVASAISDIRKAMKKKIGRPKIGSVPVLVKVPPGELADLDAWIATQEDPKPTRPEALRRLASKAIRKRKR
jgi:hypothetical protein